MKTMVRAALVLTFLLPAAAQAAEIEVKMLNAGAKGPMVFEPAFVEAQPGDVIVFVPTDKGHDVASIEGMLPDGVEPFKSPFNQEHRLEVTAEGLYGVKCTPHYGMGMVALIKVGEPVNQAEAAAVSHPGKARIVFEELMAQAGS
jgi:pseudoazurin